MLGNPSFYIPNMHSSLVRLTNILRFTHSKCPLHLLLQCYTTHYPINLYSINQQRHAHSHFLKLLHYEYTLHSISPTLCLLYSHFTGFCYLPNPLHPLHLLAPLLTALSLSATPLLTFHHIHERVILLHSPFFVTSLPSNP